MWQPQPLRKIPKVKKHSNSTTTFHNFALKIETSWIKEIVMPIFRTRNANDDAS